MNVDELFADLALAPRLSGAVCVNDPALWDPRDQGETMSSTRLRHQEAIAWCQRCPALADCSAWLSSLEPAQRPGGTVTAGQVVGAGPRILDRDLRRAKVLELIAAEPDASLRSIAERAGVDPGTVRKFRRQLASTG